MYTDVWRDDMTQDYFILLQGRHEKKGRMKQVG